MGAGHVVALATGASSFPSGAFSCAYAIFPAGGGVTIKAELLRFGPGANPFNTGADPSNRGRDFVMRYYDAYSRSKAELAALYRETSRVSFGTRLDATGIAQIGALLGQTPDAAPGTKAHAPETLDVVPLGALLALSLSANGGGGDVPVLSRGWSTG